MTNYLHRVAIHRDTAAPERFVLELGVGEQGTWGDGRPYSNGDQIILPIEDDPEKAMLVAYQLMLAAKAISRQFEGPEYPPIEEACKDE